MDPRILQKEVDSRLTSLIKTCTSQSDALNRFKMCFNELSGKEVDQAIFEKVAKFKNFLNDQFKLLSRFKSVVERAMTNKVEYDNAKVKTLECMGDLEEFIACELGLNKYKVRAEQRVLDKYVEINNDKHWRALEMVDDFVRDQLADCLAYQDVYAEITKA